jgi:single-stranded-DNA-specific exonuclease
MTAALLQNRGFDDPPKMHEMLEGQSISDPLLMLDMGKAVSTIQQAIDTEERIAVYGDYDADGVTATAMLVSYLASCGADVNYYIPEREGEGYGMNLHAIEKLKEFGIQLIVTVDNGIASIAEAKRAAELGMKLVITDHHQPQGEIPQAEAVVDPHRKEDQSPCKMLCGAGIAFKLILAMEGEYADTESLLEEYAELAMLGTIGDVVPLIGENRILVKEGLRLLPRTNRPGLRALMEYAGIKEQTLSATTVAFSLVPRLNATGRMGSPKRAVELLIGENPMETDSLAAQICADNDRRRETEEQIMEEVMELLHREPQRLLDRVIVVEGQNWHHGVIGIVSSRLTERFEKPSIVISVTGEEARGSGRSVEGFSLFDAVYSCRDLLTRFGGHPMAAGLSLAPENLELFRTRINHYAYALNCPMPVPELMLDGILKPSKISLEIPKAASLLEPFGAGNPAPLFGIFGVTLTGIHPVGNGKHLRLQVEKDGAFLQCMKFGMTAEQLPYQIGTKLDLAVTLECRPFRGQDTLSIYIREMKLSACSPELVIAGRQNYEKMLRKEALSPKEATAVLPSRSDAAKLYRILRAKNGYQGAEEGISCLIELPMEKILTILYIFSEKKLIHMEAFGGQYQITMISNPQKVDLMDCQAVHYIEQFLPEREVSVYGVSAENV